MTYTDTQLKQALAKMLPDDIEWWSDNEIGLHWMNTREVLNTELLHLCWLVEGTLINFCDYGKFERELEYLCGSLCHATWQQRTIALAKVKGINLI